MVLADENMVSVGLALNGRSVDYYSSGGLDLSSMHNVLIGLASTPIRVQTGLAFIGLASNGRASNSCLVGYDSSRGLASTPIRVPTSLSLTGLALCSFW